MKRLLVTVFAVSLLPFFTLVAEDTPVYLGEISAATGAGLTAYSSMLNRADIAIAKSIVCETNAVKGSFGETIAANTFLSKHLANSGNWLSIRTGSLTFEGNRKGIDVLYLKLDENGLPCSLMPCEVKYNTSPLGHRLDGIQGGAKWNAPRLRGLGNRYLHVAHVAQRAKMPDVTSANVLPVQLKNGKIVNFWRKEGQWYIDCSPDELTEAQHMASSYGNYLTAAGEGKITYRSRLFQIKPQGNDLTIVIKDATNLDEIGNATRLPVTGEIKISGGLSGKLPNEVHTDIVKKLKKEFPHWTDKDIDHLANDLTHEVATGQVLEKYSIWKDIAQNAGMAAIVATAFDAGIQLIFAEEINWGQAALSGGSAFVGSVVSQGINMALMHAQWMAQLGSHLNCSTQVLSSLTSSAAGAIVFNLVYAFGGWYLGYMDATTAIRSAVGGVSGAIAGVAAGAGTIALVSAYGTASTGTAIASLSGAAASNATLAFLGGGATAAGGGGVVIGSCILGGIVVSTAVIVSTSFVFGYQLFDARQETKRISGVCDKIDNPDFWNASWANTQAVRLIPAM